MLSWDCIRRIFIKLCSCQVLVVARQLVIVLNALLSFMCSSFVFVFD